MDYIAECKGVLDDWYSEDYELYEKAVMAVFELKEEAIADLMIENFQTLPPRSKVKTSREMLSYELFEAFCEALVKDRDGIEMINW